MLQNKLNKDFLNKGNDKVNYNITNYNPNLKGTQKSLPDSYSMYSTFHPAKVSTT
jgi:hypothetical protein